MGASSKAPKLPKRSVITRLTRKSAECGAEMMAVLTCFKDTSFNEAKCAAQMRALSECVSRQPEAKNKRKSTIYYHLKRLYYMQRR